MCISPEKEQELIEASAYRDRLTLWLHKIVPVTLNGPQQLVRIFGSLEFLGPSSEDQTLVFAMSNDRIGVQLNPSHGWVEVYNPRRVPVRVYLGRDASISEAGQRQIHEFLETVVPGWEYKVDGSICLAERFDPQ